MESEPWYWLRSDRSPLQRSSSWEALKSLHPRLPEMIFEVVIVAIVVVVVIIISIVAVRVRAIMIIVQEL